MITPLIGTIGNSSNKRPTDGMFEETTYAITVRNTHATQDVFFNFDASIVVEMRVPAGTFLTIDLSPINQVRVLEGKPKLAIRNIWLRGSAAGTTFELLTFDEQPSTGIQEQVKRE